MTATEAGVWVALGGIVVIALEFWSDMHRNQGVLLKKQKKIAYRIGEIVRVGARGVIAVALVDARQISGKLGALTAGMTTPLIVAR